MIAPLIVAGVSLALFAVAMLGTQRDDLRWKEAHHEYWGLLLVLVAIALRSTVVAWIGAWLMADDAVQHICQRFGDPASRVSLVHHGFALLYRIPWVERLTLWADRRLK